MISFPHSGKGHLWVLQPLYVELLIAHDDAHDDVETFSALLAICARIHWSPVN